MATNEYLNSNGYSGRYLELHWWRTGTWNGNTCGSNIHWELHGRGQASAGWYNTRRIKVVINGQTLYNMQNDNTPIKLYNGTLVASGDISIQHDSNGSKYFTASIEAGIFTYAVNCSASGGWWLDSIPRNLDSISLSEVGHGYNYLEVRWNCSPARDYTQYSLNGGAWTDAGDSGTTSGSFRVSNLSENTRYTIKVRLRRADSQLWSESNTLTITTASGHTAITQFNVDKVSGRSDQLKITWAAGNACDYGWYSKDNGKTWIGGLSYPTQIISGLSDGTSYSIKIKVRRSDSQMVTESGTVTQTTYTQTRFTKSNVNHVSGYNGLSQLQVEWATNITINKLEISLDNGSTWARTLNPNTTSGTYTLTSLSMNTYYNVKLRATSSNGSVVTTTGTIKQSTYNKVTGSLYKNGVKLSTTTGIQITTTDKLEFKEIVNNANCSYKFYLETPDNTRRITQTSNVFTASQIQSMFQYLPNVNSQAFNIGIATMNGTTEAQYVDWYGSLIVTNSNPIFNNFTYEDMDATCRVLTGGNQGIIKGYSDVKITVSNANKAIGKDYATMQKYRMVIGEKQQDVNYSASNSISGTLNNVNSNVFTVYAIDSRGNSTAKVISPSAYYAYTDIKLTKIIAERTNIVGKETRLRFEGEYWNQSFGSIVNSITSCYYQYKKSSSNTWINGATTLTPEFNGKNFSFEGLIKGDEGAEGFGVTDAFDIRVIVKDRLSQSILNTILGSATPQIAIASNGVAINGMYDESLEKGFQINGKLYLNGVEIRS